MKTLYKNTNILLPEPLPRFEQRNVLVDDDTGLILAVGDPAEVPTGDRTIDLDGALLSPGLVDVHTHGRAGGDFVSADVELLRKMSDSYLDAGVTTVMPTLASAPLEDFGAAADRIATVAKETFPTNHGGARFSGLHLEGRYLNPAKRGAHAEALLAPLDPAELHALHKRMCLPYQAAELPFPMRLSAALESDANGAFSQAARELGIELSLGHTTADYDRATELVAHHGVRGFTHLYNAMPQIHHRAGGTVVACFHAAHGGLDVYGELICDGLHIAPEMIALAYAMLGYEHTVLISDSMEGTGCPDGDYSIAGEHVTLKGGIALTDSGALAGSTLNLFDGVNNLIRFCNIPVAQALRCATLNPARLAGIEHAGRIRPGATADLLVLRAHADSTLDMQAVLIGGRCVRGSLT